MLERFRLDGRVAIITGAGRGIGAAIATTFAEVGADVVITARTPKELATVAEGVAQHGRRALIRPGDVNDLGFLAELVDATMDEFGRLDVVVNNAGGSASKPYLETTVADLEGSFHFNISAPFELTRLAVPHLLASDAAAVVNIGSVAGRNASRGSLTHSLTKAALAQLTRLMAIELAPKIRANAVLPGAIETAALQWWLTTLPEGVADEIRTKAPMRRNGMPDDIAAAVLYCATPASSWVTGKLLEVDGGLMGETHASRQPDL